MIPATVVEIAVQDVAGARAALSAGAHRLELCQALAMGGLTPSIGLLDSVLAAVDPQLVNVLVRPRGGGFVYTDDEIDVVAADIRACTERGVGGVVLGALTRDGHVDHAALETWRAAAGRATVTFHRAIDAVQDPLSVLAELRGRGVDRVLTSGGAARAVDGIDVLAHFVEQGSGIEIMAGGGVRPEDIPSLRAAGVRAVHLSARRSERGDDPAGPGGGAAGHDVTDPQIVAAAVTAARA